MRTMSADDSAEGGPRLSLTREARYSVENASDILEGCSEDDITEMLRVVLGQLRKVAGELRRNQCLVEIPWVSEKLSGICTPCKSDPGGLNATLWRAPATFLRAKAKMTSGRCCAWCWVSCAKLQLSYVGISVLSRFPGYQRSSQGSAIHANQIRGGSTTSLRHCTLCGTNCAHCRRIVKGGWGQCPQVEL